MFTAGILTMALGLIHSILGEVLIFRRMRTQGLVPTDGAPLLRERHVRILWVTWHLTSIFGWALGTFIFLMATSSSGQISQKFALINIQVTMCIGGLLVIGGTRAKHPAWIILFTIAALLWLSQL